MPLTGRIDPARLPEERLAQASPDLPARAAAGVREPADVASHRGPTQPQRRIIPKYTTSTDLTLRCDVAQSRR
jgi:hypothetical protein